MTAAGERFSAKFSLPVLNETVYPRHRLFELIRAAFERRAVVWVDGPAGAGKTTLGAGFLAEEQAAASWYQMDVGDSEPGVFFAEIARLLAPRLLEAPELPAYDGRLPVDPRRFAHHFFQALFAQLPPDHILVFDDYHEIEAASPLHDIISVLLSQQGALRPVLILSRNAPPAPLADLLPSGRLVRLDWEVLRLDEEETDRLTERLLPAAKLRPPALRALRSRVHGWPAGLVLLLQQAAKDGLAKDLPEPSTPEAVNAFFNAELDRRLEAQDLACLRRLALFPSFTAAMARKLVPATEPTPLLEGLARQNFFVSRHQQQATVYRFHPLLRESLARQLSLEIPPEQQRQLLLRAGQILDEHDYPQDALDLYLQARAWSQGEALFLKLAPQLAMAGAYHSMEGWLARFPAEGITDSGWLLYWRGLCRWPRDPALGRADLEQAFHRFTAQDDGAGRLHAWCSLLEVLVLEWGDLHPIDHWLGLQQELAEDIAAAPPPLQERVTLTLFTAYSYRRPQAPEMRGLTEAAHTLFIRSQDLLLKVLAGNHLGFYYAFMRGDLARAGVYVEEIDLICRETEPVARVVSHAMLGVMEFWLRGDVAGARKIIDEGLAFAEDAGVHFWDFMFNAMGAWVSIAATDYPRARHYLEELGRGLQHDALINRCVYHDTQAILQLHLGDIPLADRHSQMSLELAHQGGMPYAEAACLLTRSRVKTLLREYDQAAELRAEAWRLAEPMDNAFAGYHLRMFEAAEAYQRLGPRAPETLAALAKALREGVARRFHGNLWLDRPTLTNLYHLGIACDLEPDYLRTMIFRYGLRPASQRWALDGWPFALRIKVLAGLEVSRLTLQGYEPVQITGRAAQLLEVLVWNGGQRIDQQYLTDFLWPDAEGDAARRSFDTTLHRLRRQLGDDRLLQLSEGRLSLDASLCAHDVAALEQTLEALGTLLAGQGDPAALAAVQDSLLQQVTALRPNNASPLFAPLYNRLLVRVRQKLEALAAHRLRTGDAEEAVAPLEAVVRLDPLAESAYELLMRSHLERRRPGEALAVFTRCAESLERHLGAVPGDSFQALRARALDANGKPKGSH